MTLGGGGVPGIERGWEVVASRDPDLRFIPRRFQVGGRFSVEDNERARNVRFNSCVLCGGIMHRGDMNFEHVLPQWLHRLAGDVGERTSNTIPVAAGRRPTWRQLELGSHKNCNSLFAKYIENPAKTAISSMVNGDTVTNNQLDAVLDWLDKVVAAAAHMGLAFTGHHLTLKYGDHSFPNWRIGAWDRAAMFFRTTDYEDSLSLWDCTGAGFLTTPSALVLQIKDLVIVSASNSFMLSSAFGLSKILAPDGVPVTEIEGDGKFMSGFGDRATRLPFATVIAQPMRRLLKQGGFQKRSSPALAENGDGKIYRLREQRWERVKSLNFANLPKLQPGLGYDLASLEAVEWILLHKEMDFLRRGKPEKFFANNSIQTLKQDKATLLGFIDAARPGLSIHFDDRALA